MLLKMSFWDYVISPFAWLLRIFYEIGGNYVLALCLFAIVFKVLLLPSSISQQKGMAKQQRLQPKIRRIQAKFAGDQKKIQEETQALYQRDGYNPMNAGCLPLLIQLPIIYVLYEVIYSPLKYVLSLDSGILTALSDAVKKLAETNSAITQAMLSSRRIELTIIEYFDEISHVVTDKGALDSLNVFIDKFTFLGVPLGDTPSWSTFKNWSGSDQGAKLLLLIPLLSGFTALLTGLITFIRQKRTNPDMAKNPASGCMTFMMPLMSVYFAFLFPAGIGLYWIFQNILSAIQMLILNSIYSNEKVMARMMVAETVQRRSKEENDKIVAKNRK